MSAGEVIGVEGLVEGEPVALQDEEQLVPGLLVIERAVTAIRHPDAGEVAAAMLALSWLR